MGATIRNNIHDAYLVTCFILETGVPWTSDRLSIYIISSFYIILITPILDTCYYFVLFYTSLMTLPKLQRQNISHQSFFERLFQCILGILHWNKYFSPFLFSKDHSNVNSSLNFFYLLFGYTNKPPS